MLAKKPLKSQFVLMFVLILTLSVMATITSYGVGYMILIKMIEHQKIYPANYYENKIPEIEAYVRGKGADLLHPSERKELEQFIPLEGISYQVMDVHGTPIYGSVDQRIIQNQEELFRKINATFTTNGKYVKLIPVIDAGGKIEGGVALAYTLTPLTLHYRNITDKIWVVPLFTAILFSPFVYVVIFTWLFAKKFAGNIGKPLNMLADAARKIKEKNLDFHLSYEADNELGRLCQAFNEMKNQLRESLLSQWKAERERQDMVAALAHDLQTPFSTIAGYAEALQEGKDDKRKIEKYLQTIKENAHKGSKLIKDMLYAAELENAGGALELVPVDLSAFLTQKKENYELMGREKKVSIKVQVTYENREQKILSVDVGKLERILDNILSNSIRYTPEHGTIAIHAGVSRDNIRITVCDSGKGFTGKDLAHVFHKFYRGDESRPTKDGHAGLGLYIAKKLVEMHGGRIQAYNAKDGGACIEFLLKLFP